ncbi:unnamed protein product [Allacma fusca]|uniref:DDE-1 domain-containing protein n=1 Tax=Allacma fusca TaxID=39272 RepID=A0A8J2JVF3_9HEXA|nr:unnamed protein product [Allacma fusca]
MRTGTPTSLIRITYFTKTAVYAFFDKLETINQEKRYDPARIFNVDETGAPIVAPKLVADGHYVPPMFVFPKSAQFTRLSDASTGTIFTTSNKGWSTTITFLKWIKHFKIHATPNENTEVLLLLDNHASHISDDVVGFADNNFAADPQTDCDETGVCDGKGGVGSDGSGGNDSARGGGGRDRNSGAFGNNGGRNKKSGAFGNGGVVDGGGCGRDRNSGGCANSGVEDIEGSIYMEGFQIVCSWSSDGSNEDIPESFPSSTLIKLQKKPLVDYSSSSDEEDSFGLIPNFRQDQVVMEIICTEDDTGEMDENIEVIVPTESRGSARFAVSHWDLETQIDLGDAPDSSKRKKRARGSSELETSEESFQQLREKERKRKQETSSSEERRIARSTTKVSSRALRSSVKAHVCN